MTEQDIQNSIRIRLSELGFAVFRANVGKIKLSDGRWFDTGLPKGFSDLFAVRDGKIYFIEVKKPGGKIRPEQTAFIETMKIRYGCTAGIVYSPEEAIELVTGGT
ncbi:MAG: VRR-NUC domain-containing protein [Oscillospiraceae bacterium]|nr:VRR-NUC domain-containing protein [Oscillospiraceae bacterium]